MILHSGSLLKLHIAVRPGLQFKTSVGGSEVEDEEGNHKSHWGIVLGKELEGFFSGYCMSRSSSV